jgi:hypothetical protein
MNPSNALLHRLSRRQRRVLLVWATTPLVAAAIWLQAGGPRGEFPEHLVYSFAIATLTWLWIDLGRWPAQRWLGLVDSNDWPAPIPAALWITSGVFFGYVAGTAIGDAYAGHSTWQLLSVDRQRFGAIIASSLLVALGFTAFFWQKALAERLARQAQQAQLRLLQSQLDPHLMFNTLAHLRALVQSDAVQATAMLDRFIAYLRSTLSATQATSHALSQEFFRLQDYLTLMQMRMGTRLHYEMALAPELKSHPIPSMLLQPIVENAILHGLEPHIPGGTVRITAEQDGAQRFRICVSDDGAGCPITPTPGFGLRSVLERVQSYYGDQGRVQIEATSKGMCVTLYLPLSTP